MCMYLEHLDLGGGGGVPDIPQIFLTQQNPGGPLCMHALVNQHDSELPLKWSCSFLEYLYLKSLVPCFFRLAQME